LPSQKRARGDGGVGEKKERGLCVYHIVHQERGKEVYPFSRESSGRGEIRKGKKKDSFITSEMRKGWKGFPPAPQKKNSVPLLKKNRTKKKSG